MTIAELLRDPPNKYRPIPFWSWNEKLSVEETRRQIAEMNRVGIGGYFMHARGGLQTPYMGDEWMDNIAAGIDEARQRDMGAWVYDENGWPSGFGDGRVNGLGIEYQQKYLRMEETAEDKETRGQGDKGTQGDERTITVVETPDGKSLRFYYDVNPFYVDTLDAHVVKTFIEMILEAYAERFADDLGGAMPGVFTDEPQVSRNGIPWSFTLPDKYREAYGEELLPLLPQLFLPVDMDVATSCQLVGSDGAAPSGGQAGCLPLREFVPYKRTRYRFWHLVQELFVTSFTQQMYDWCEGHGAQLTGHMVLEETFLAQLTSNAAVMPHYEFFHVPGMDWLGRHIDPPTTPLQVASVAHQLGRKQILSETFALCGWNVSWEELKWMYEWQCVRGVTQLCQHLEGYSLRGIRKRDYPPSLFFQQPWWDKYRAFNDYASRLGMLLAEGEVQFDVLVIHPQASAWLVYDDGQNDGIEGLFQEFLSLAQTLEGAKVPFHYGDERILRRHGKAEADRLRVGRQRYSVVIVPSCQVLARSTVDLLHQFVGAGGILLWSGEKPSLVEGEPDARLAALTSKGRDACTDRELMSALPPAVVRVAVTGPDGYMINCIASTRRHFGDFDGRGPADCYFFANADDTHGYDTNIRLFGQSAERLQLEDGCLQAVPFEVERGRMDALNIAHYFPPMGSLALLVYPDDRATSVAASAKDVESLPSSFETVSLDGDWNLELLDPNALTLDYCDVWIDRKLVAENEHISVVQGRCLAYERPVDLRLRFPVRTAQDFDPEGDLFLVAERPEELTISVNGVPLDAPEAGCYRDTSFRKLPLNGMVRHGRNEIIVETRFEQSNAVYEQLEKAKSFEAEKNKLTFDKEIEALYLIGSFGVATPDDWTELPRSALRYGGDFMLTALPKTVPLSDPVRNGLPFFNGTVRLTRQVDLTEEETRARLFRFDAAHAHIVSVSVNGQCVKELYWRPFEAELGGLLRAGENEIALELTNGLRNLLGPHHLEEGESYGVAPPSFYKEPSVFGCAGQWNDDYCFVQFGLEGAALH